MGSCKRVGGCFHDPASPGRLLEPLDGREAAMRPALKADGHGPECPSTAALRPISPSENQARMVPSHSLLSTMVMVYHHGMVVVVTMVVVTGPPFLSPFLRPSVPARSPVRGPCPSTGHAPIPPNFF